MTRRLHTDFHIRREHLIHTWKIFALIAALILLQSYPLSSVQAQVAPSEISGAPSPSLPEASQASKDVDLRFELVPPALSGEPNLLVQLDGGNSSSGGDSDTIFAGLLPGLHTARVILMDANDQPLQGGIALVHFRVHAARAAEGSTEAATPLPRDARGAEPGPPPIPPELRSEGDPGPPMKGSPLLLVSLIGFALLIGGIMRPRKVTTAHP
jgi:hypothetical protein